METFTEFILLDEEKTCFFKKMKNTFFVWSKQGIIYANSIKKWEPNEKMSPSEKARVARLIEKYYQEVYNPDGFLG